MHKQQIQGYLIIDSVFKKRMAWECPNTEAPPAGMREKYFSKSHKTCPPLFLYLSWPSPTRLFPSTLSSWSPAANLPFWRKSHEKSWLHWFLSFHSDSTQVQISRSHPLSWSPLDNWFDVNPQVILARSLSHQQRMTVMRVWIFFFLLLWLLIFAKTPELFLRWDWRWSPWQPQCWSPSHCWEVCSASQTRRRAPCVPPIKK